jgi:hypothetical protein
MLSEGIETAARFVQDPPGTDVNDTRLPEVQVLLPEEIDCEPYVPGATPTVSPHAATA